ncbi:MAG: beta-galactosidase [Armatimonadota bacterium]
MIWRLWFGLLLAWLLATALVTAAPVRFGILLPPNDGLTDAAFGKFCERAKAAGVQQLTLRADWPRIQPARTSWNFTWLDARIEAATKRGLQVTLMFGSSPKWAVSYLRQPGPAELARARPDLPAFRAYVVAVAKRYQNRVRNYQAWERPGPTTLLAIPSDINALFITATRAVHQVNPSLRVTVPEPGDIELGWIADYLRIAGGLDRADAIALNLGHFTRTPEALWWRMSVLRERVLPAQRAPELCVTLPPAGEKETSSLTMMAAALLQGIPLITLTPGNTTTLPIDDPGVRTGLSTLATLPGTEYAGWQMLAAGVPAGLFRAQRTSVLALPFTPVTLHVRPANTTEETGVIATGESIEVAACNGASRHLTVGQGTDLALATNPVVMQGAAMDTVAGWPNIIPKPVAGDTISLNTAGTRLDAIHAMLDLPGGQCTLEDINGSRVYHLIGRVAPWLHLDIPDGFLFYNNARLPIEVTVRVYGVKEVNRSGFNLYYDALHGMTYSAWQWVGVGPDKLYTYKFTLIDALFADRAGYDLRINLAGSKENLRIADVQVRKLKPGTK